MGMGSLFFAVKIQPQGDAALSNFPPA